MTPKVVKEEIKYKGDFLDFKIIHWIDKNGNEAKWEAANRAGGIEDVVSVIPILIPSMRYVVIRMFRPPVNGYVLTFPAGLVDIGESIQKAALRELKEETGYIGSVVKITPPTLSSAGMSNETVSNVVVHIDENDSENKNPIQNLEAEEDIEVILVREKDIDLFIKEEIQRGSILSGRMTSYFLGKDLI